MKKHDNTFRFVNVELFVLKIINIMENMEKLVQLGGNF